jgi:hypothetical protein
MIIIIVVNTLYNSDHDRSCYLQVLYETNKVMCHINEYVQKREYTQGIQD